jgi:3-hydroxyisobutyrate dehydrogenase
MNIAFIGIGVMGKSMAKNLLNGKNNLAIYTRTKEKALELIESGAVWHDTVRDAVKNADAVISMVGYPKDVEDIYLGRDGIIASAKPNALLIDMTTSSPSLAKKIYNEAGKKNLRALDAPVSGGDIGAQNATLSIMAGGDKKDFAAAQPIFSLMGKNIRHMGSAGAGQYTKMANQIAIASNMMGVCEAIFYAEKMGLDAHEVLAAISSGAAGSWSLSNLAPRILKDDFSPGFFVKHFIKDMKIAVESAREMNLTLPGLELALSLYEKLAANGGENYGTQALIKVLK